MALMLSIFTWGQTVLLSPTGDGGFETGPTFADNGWTTVNDATNKWFVGTVSTPYAGTNAAFISNDNGVTNAYTNTSTQVSYFYRDITVPAGETIITLTFQWKNNGESGSYDRPFVYIAPTTSTPVANSMTVTGSTDITGTTNYLVLQTTYQTATYTLPASLAGTTFRLIIGYKNDSSGGNQPPASIDNISLTSRALNPLHGIYSIDNTLPTTPTLLHDGSDNFNSFTAAINYLNSDGISGAVTFNVISGQTFAENTPAITATGTVTNTITFVKSGAGANPVITPTGTSGSSDAGITIAGGDYFTFDGIDINANAVTAVEYGYYVRNASATDGAQYNIVKNCNISLNRSNTSSRAIYQNVSSTPSSATGANSYNKYQSITVSNTYSGIFLTGNATYNDLMSEISNCTIGAASANDIGNGTSTMNGIRITSNSDISVFNNEIRNMTITGANNLYGMYIESLKGTANNIYNNRIHDLTSTSTSTSSLIYALRTDINASMICNVYNNMIFGLQHGITTANVTNVIRGIAVGVSGTGTGNFYYNSVRIDEDAAPSSQCFYINGGTANLKNNVFANFSTADATSKRYCIYRNGGTLTNVNYNDYYIATGTNNFIGYYTSDQATLANWQTASSTDANSKSVDPLFIGISDLHSASNDLNASGITISIANGDALDIITDIDGDSRNAATPDMGADEFDPPTCGLPTALTSSNLNYTTATISWTAPAGTPVGYEYEVRTSGAAGSGATGLAASGTTLSPTVTADITGLSGATTYTYYVRTDCGASDYSPWTSGTFNTLSCNVPTGVVASAITTSGATITWVAPATGSPAGYEYEVRSSGAAGSGATGLAASGTTTSPTVTADITGLTDATAYSIYVRTNCSPGFYSAWTSAVTFTTLCFNYSLTVTEGFNAAATIPTCWSQQFVTNSLSFTYPTTGTGTPSPAPQEGSRLVMFNSYSNSGSQTRLVSPAITTTGISSVDVEFQWHFSSNGGATSYLTEGVQVQYSTDGSTWTNAGSLIRRYGATTGWSLQKVTLPAGAGEQSTVYVGFLFTSNAGYDSYLDAVVIKETPACIEPTALVSSAITSVSATISWTASASTPANGYDYYVSTTNTAPDGATVPTGSVAAGITTADLSSLSANTTYYFWVRSNCDGVNYSAWAGYGSFYTGYCLPAPSSVDGTGITNVSFGQTVLVNNATSAETNNYGDYSAMIGDAMQFSTLNVSITYSTGYTYGTKIWVDWNNDLDFVDAGELMYTGLSGSSTPTTLTASFAIPGTTPIGNYRMRIGGTDENTGPSTPCYTGTYGSFEDYTLQVTLAPPCAEMPTALASSAITNSSATISWTAPSNAPANGYQYYLATTAAPVPDAATTATGSTAAGITSVDLASLTGNTTYYIWVRANCDDVNFSNWLGSLSFTTECDFFTPQLDENFTTYLPQCWKEFTGLLADPTVTSGTTSGWGADGFANVGTTGSAKVNIYGTGRKDWVVSPRIDLGDGSVSYVLTFDLALTIYDGTAVANTTGTDDKFAVVISTDNGATWSSANTLRLWDNAGSPYVYNDIATSGENVKINLSAYTGVVRIGFYGESTASNADNDLFVDNFTVRELSLGTDILTFSLPEQTATPVVIDNVNHTVNIEVASGTDLSSLTPSITVSPNATINPLSGTAQDFTLPFDYTVTAEDLTTQQVWTVTVTAAITQSSEKDILTFSFDEETSPAIIGTNTVDIQVAWDADLSNLIPTITTSVLSSINPLSGVANDFTSPVTYTVTAEDASTKDYTVTVTQEATPAGYTCAAAIDYGTVNDPEVTGTMSVYRPMWYRLTTTQPFANVDIHSCGSDFDTKIAIFEDCGDVTTLPENNVMPQGAIAFNDDSDGSYCSVDYNQSLIEFNVLPAGTYYIVIYPYSTTSTLGNYALKVFGDADACLAPTTLALTDLQQEEVTINWATAFTETEWNLIYGATGFDPATQGTLLTNVTYPYNLTGLTEATGYDVYVQSICSGPSTSAWSSVLSFTTLAACPAPTDLVINNTDVDAELSWTAWGTTAWNLKVSTTVIDPATGTGDVFDGPVGTNPYTIGSLTPNTTYYYYLQADCGAGETSLWSVQGSFTTECAALSAFNQNFDGVTTPALPSCWSKYLSPSYSYETVNTYTTAPYSSPNCVQLYSSGATAATDAPMLISPLLLNLNSGTSQLRFYAKGASTNTSVIVGTMSDPLNSASFTPLQTVTGLSTSAWNEYTISLATYAGTDEYIAFRHPLTTTYSYIYIDNVVLEPIPSCQVPTYLTYSNLTTSSATISWTASPSDPANGYDYYVSTSSTAPDGTTVPTGSVAAGITTADLSLLSENTTYYFWVRANCDGTDYSTWAGYESFFTGYCTPTATSTATYISNFVTTGGESNISNNSGAFATGGYIDYYPSMFASHYATGVINFSTTIVGGTAGIAIYIDWNNDMDFSDAGERVYTSNAYQGTGTTSSSFTVPSDAVIGDYRMRIVTDYNSTNPVPCSFAYGRGEAEDYKFTVVPLPACPTPANLFADNISTNTANLNWTQLGSATAWNLKASTTPIDPSVENGDFGIIPTTTNPFITPAVLSENTTYYWYVQADCGGGSTSGWSAQGEFTTLCEAITTIPFNETFNSDSPTESCWTVLNENGDGDTWNTNYTSNPYEGNQVAALYTDGNAGANNDYLVSPGITLTGNEILTYQYRVQSQYEPNDFEVLLSTTGIAPADFTTVLLPNASYSNTTYAMHTIDLSSYTGTVYIAWHVINGGLDGWRIYIDDVTVRETSDENDILTFSFAEQTGAAVIDAVNHTVDVEVAMGTNPNGIVPTFTISDYATVDFATGVAQDFTTPFVYTVTSESSIDQAWTVNVSIATTQSSENDILTFTLPQQTGPATIDAVNHTVDVEVTWNTALTSLTPAITISTLATINPLSGTAQDFSAPFTYTVTAEDATPQDWIVTVTNAPAPQGATCSDPLIYGMINDPAINTALLANEPQWYVFTLDATYNNVLVNTCGSDFDDRIAIYADCADFDGNFGYSNISFNPAGDIGYDDDGCNGGEYVSGSANAATFNMGTMNAGTYYVVIFGYTSTSAGNVRLEITGDPLPTIDVIDVNSDVADIEVCQGVAAGTAIGSLAQQITITDTDLNEYNVFLSWTIDSYDANTPGDYNATGTFTLPSGVEQTDPVTPLEVYATVTVLAPPVVTCPGDFEVTDINTVALTGESPAGGIYSGTGVTAGEFSADGLVNGDYMLTYTYTDPTTMCSNYCDFTVTVNIPLPVIDVIDVNNDVQDVAVCLGAVEADALALLTSEITISDADANEHVVSVTWTIAAFDGNTAADYNATGTFELPATVAQTDPETTLEVYAVVTVNDLPVVTCPDNFSVTAEGAVTITGATPDGGTFSGTGITGNNFDPATLANGDYIITYSYTDAVTGCTNSCDFTITVDIDNSINVSESAAVSIYPNPNNGMFKLNFSNVNGNVNYQVYDTKGSIIVDENILTNGNTVKEVSLNLVPGVYYVKLITAGQTVVEKLVIE